MRQWGTLKHVEGTRTSINLSVFIYLGHSYNRLIIVLRAFLFPATSVLLLHEDPSEFPGEMGIVIPPACSGFASDSHPSWASKWSETLVKQSTGRQIVDGEWVEIFYKT